MLTDEINPGKEQLQDEQPKIRKRVKTSSIEQDSLLVVKGQLDSSSKDNLTFDEDEEKRERCLKVILDARLAAKEAGKPLKLPLFSYDDCPSFLQDNEFIWTGYRAFYPYDFTWRSMFTIHNESGNIWTHLFGFVSSLALIAYIYYNMPPGSTLGDFSAFTFYLTCSGICFLCSTLFHTHYVHSRKAYLQFGCLDYAGISTMICGGACTLAYFAWYCQPVTRVLWLMVLVGVSSIGLIGPLFDIWTNRAFRKTRTLIYILSGFVSGGPLFHFIFSFGFPESLGFPFYKYLFLGLFLYLIGAYIYANRIPEMWFPGKFDLYFHSHQWWHVAVFTAFYLHYHALNILLDWRLNLDQCGAQ